MSRVKCRSRDRGAASLVRPGEVLIAILVSRAVRLSRAINHFVKGNMPITRIHDAVAAMVRAIQSNGAAVRVLKERPAFAPQDDQTIMLEVTVISTAGDQRLALVEINFAGYRPAKAPHAGM
jgi:hypothetical protein